MLFYTSKSCKKNPEDPPHEMYLFNVLQNPQFKVTGKSYGDVIGAEEGSTPPDSPIFITLSFSYFL